METTEIRNDDNIYSAALVVEKDGSPVMWFESFVELVKWADKQDLPQGEVILYLYEGEFLKNSTVEQLKKFEQIKF